MAFLKDEEKQSLVDRYCDIEWCDEVTGLRCVHCHRVVINHCVSSCQHIFCKICSKFYSDDEQQLKCPQCQELITQPISQDDKDFDVEIKIHQLKMCCPNKKYGCKYADQLRKMPSHLLICIDTQRASISMEATPSTKVTSLDVIIGELKEKIIEVNNKVEEKLNQLEKKTDDNDKKLNTLLERVTNMDKKLAETNAGMELSPKTYTGELLSMKSQLETINKKINHESLLQLKMSSKVESLRIEMASMSQDVKVLQSKNSNELYRPRSETFEWTITNVKKNLQPEKSIPVLESDVITFVGYQDEMNAVLKKHHRTIFICLQFRDDTVNQSIKKRDFATVKYIMRDQQNIENPKDIISEAHLKFDECVGQCRKWMLAPLIHDEMLAPPYVKNDCIKITIVSEPSSVDRSFISNDGVLLWKIDDYQTKMEQLPYRDIWSPSFYTSPQGYRVKIRLSNMYTKPMILQVHFLTGEHDAALSLDFPHKTTVTLFNQTNPLNNLVMRERRKDVKICTMILYGSESYEQNGFIKDNSLRLKVEIEPVACM